MRLDMVIQPVEMPTLDAGDNGNQLGQYVDVLDINPSFYHKVRSARWFLVPEP